MWPGAWSSRTHEARVCPDFVRPRACRIHGLLEHTLEGTKAQESTDRLTAPWPGRRSKSENGLSRRAKLRSGRAGRRVRRARPIRDETSQTTAATRHVRRPSDSGEPSSRPCSPASLRASCGERSAQRGKEPRTPRTVPRRWAVDANPQGRKGPRERVRLLGKGKLCRATPEGASGMEQGREASGRHGERRAPRGGRACRERGRNRREGQEP